MHHLNQLQRSMSCCFIDELFWISWMTWIELLGYIHLCFTIGQATSGEQTKTTVLLDGTGLKSNWPYQYHTRGAAKPSVQALVRSHLDFCTPAVHLIHHRMLKSASTFLIPKGSINKLIPHTQSHSVVQTLLKKSEVQSPASGSKEVSMFLPPSLVILSPS